MSVVVLDYGCGNIGSFENMLIHIGVDKKEIRFNIPEKLDEMSHLILPGVGKFDTAMNNLRNRDLIGRLQEIDQKGIPILGVCLGMQIMGQASQEGTLKGLGWFDGSCFAFNTVESNHRSVHMGWEYLNIPSQTTNVFDLEHKQKFYFMHSYHYKTSNDTEISAYSTHNEQKFVAAISKDNKIGVQFHPEKSHRFGMRLLKKFLNLSVDNLESCREI